MRRSAKKNLTNDDHLCDLRSCSRTQKLESTARTRFSNKRLICTFLFVQRLISIYKTSIQLHIVFVHSINKNVLLVSIVKWSNDFYNDLFKRSMKNTNHLCIVEHMVIRLVTNESFQIKIFDYVEQISFHSFKTCLICSNKIKKF